MGISREACLIEGRLTLVRKSWGLRFNREEAAKSERIFTARERNID